MTVQATIRRFISVGLGTMLAAAAILLCAGALQAAGGHDSSQPVSDHAGPSMEGKKGAAMDHQQMSGGFQHQMTAEGVKAEFQIMSLESMNMKDAGGATHHVMVKFMDADNGNHIKEAVGRIKVIGPSKKETVVDMKDYGGIYAANFTVDEPGQYGMICLAKVAGKKPLYKFWYPHP